MQQQIKFALPDTWLLPRNIFEESIVDVRMGVVSGKGAYIHRFQG
jgi:hypothetical protein